MHIQKTKKNPEENSSIVSVAACVVCNADAGEEINIGLYQAPGLTPVSLSSI